MTVTVYHNPESKASRDVLDHIRAQGIEPVIVDVIRDAPSRSDLIRIINRGHLSPRDILCEREAKARGIRADMNDITKLLTLMAQNPRLLDHPIVLTDRNSRVCRTTEQVEELI